MLCKISRLLTEPPPIRDEAKEVAASPCVNPVVDRWWDFAGHRYHVKGLHRYCESSRAIPHENTLTRSVEEVKERNGPFAGKRVARPVANYEACHTAVVAHLQAALGNKFDQVAVASFMFYTDVET